MADSKSFEYLVNQLSLSSGTTGNIQDTPVYFVYGGYRFGSSYSVSSDGYYWSSVNDVGGYNAYYLNFNVNDKLYTDDYDSRQGGAPVRCVAR